MPRWACRLTLRVEEVRVEREPITDANLDAATSGPAISEEEHEVTLREEEVVVDKRAVPKERVRLDTETVTDQETVSDEVRKERIEAETDAAVRAGNQIVVTTSAGDEKTTPSESPRTNG